jgi:hypothetical protein
MSKYILDDTPRTPFAIKHIEEVSITLAILVAVVVGVCFWSSIDYDKKVVFVMALIVMASGLVNVFIPVIEYWYKK